MYQCDQCLAPTQAYPWLWSSSRVWYKQAVWFEPLIRLEDALTMWPGKSAPGQLPDRKCLFVLRFPNLLFHDDVMRLDKVCGVWRGLFCKEGEKAEITALWPNRCSPTGLRMARLSYTLQGLINSTAFYSNSIIEHTDITTRHIYVTTQTHQYVVPILRWCTAASAFCCMTCPSPTAAYNT